MVTLPAWEKQLHCLWQLGDWLNRPQTTQSQSGYGPILASTPKLTNLSWQHCRLRSPVTHTKRDWSPQATTLGGCRATCPPASPPGPSGSTPASKHTLPCCEHQVPSLLPHTEPACG